MPSATTLVIGATGRVGRLVVGALGRSGATVRAFSRDASHAHALLGNAVELATGDLDDAASLERALAGIERVFLLNALGPQLARRDEAVIAAARSAGVTHIVKLSGSSWTMHPGAESASGAQHLRAERALAASGVPYSIIRPNAFMQGTLGRVAAELDTGDRFALALGTSRAALIDVRDIADVAGHLLLTAPGSGLTYDITGPVALDGAAIARAASTLLQRRVSCVEVDRETVLANLRAQGASEFDLLHRAEMMSLMRAGAAAGLTDTIPRVLGRPARDVSGFFAAALQGGATPPSVR